MIADQLMLNEQQYKNNANQQDKLAELPKFNGTKSTLNNIHLQQSQLSCNDKEVQETNLQKIDSNFSQIISSQERGSLKTVISKFLLCLTDKQAEAEYENEQLTIKKPIFLVIRIFRLLTVAMAAYFLVAGYRYSSIEYFILYIYPIVQLLELVYTLLVIFRWQNIKRYVTVFETIFIVIENIFYNYYMADIILGAINKQEIFSPFSIGQQTVLITLTGVLVIDSYLLKSVCILSLNSYIVNEQLDQVNIVYIITSDVVIIILAWLLQKETKLFFYENYVQKKSVKNFKDYFHKTLSQPIIVVKLKNSCFIDSLQHNVQTNSDISTASILDVLYCNKNATEELFEQGRYLLDKLIVKQDAQNIPLGVLIAQKIQQSQLNTSIDTFNSYDFLQTGEEQYIPSTEISVSNKNLTKEKQRKFYSVKWNTCIWEGQYGCILQVSDITLQHENAEKIQWQKINEYKDELLATVSHDLKTPLNSILISVQAMNRDQVASEFEEYRAMAINNSLYLEHLISDIMDYSMIQKGKLRVVPIIFSLESLLTNIQRIFNDQCEQKNITLIIENNVVQEEEYKHTIFTRKETLQLKNSQLYNDQKRISQILINLVSNALKFTDKGCITVKAQQDQDISNAIKISVRDTGSGIPLDLQSKLFEMFSTFDHNQGQNKHGVGLGLCIAKNLARLLGPRDKIELSSVPGEGSCFSFSVFKDMSGFQYENIKDGEQNILNRDMLQQGSQPSSNQAIQNLQDDKVELENAEICLSNPERTMNLIGLRKPELRKLAKILGSQDKTILVVDDYPYNIRAVRILFQGSRFTIEGATSADSGLAMLMLKKYDLCLFDVNMPVKDGLSLTREVRELVNQNKIADICIIQCTAYDTEQDKINCLQAGADSFLSKPITYDKLINSLQIALQKYRIRHI